MLSQPLEVGYVHLCMTEVVLSTQCKFEYLVIIQMTQIKIYYMNKIAPCATSKMCMRYYVFINDTIFSQVSLN